MSEPFLAEVRIFSTNFAPRGWAMCDGQLLPLSQNLALFALLGTTYGGDGRTTFALPDLRGRIPMHAGTGPGLSPRQLGAKSGTEQVTLTEAQLPAHDHGFEAVSDPGDSRDPTGKALASSVGELVYQTDTVSNLVGLGASGAAGGGQPHNNLQPYAVLSYCIALVGILPDRA